jgi:hypothetical protein
VHGRTILSADWIFTQAGRKGGKLPGTARMSIAEQSIVFQACAMRKKKNCFVKNIRLQNKNESRGVATPTILCQTKSPFVSFPQKGVSLADGLNES